MIDEDALVRIENKLTHMEKLLMGNGTIGIAEMARRAFEFCQNAKVSKQGFIDWLFRAIILIFLGFIAAKVGLK